MYCNRCQIEYPAGKKFCRQCGESLKPKAFVSSEVARCPNCSASVLPNIKFCGSCGTSLVGKASTPVEPARLSSPGTGRQVEEELLEEQIKQQRKKILKGEGISIGGVGLLGVVLVGGLFAYRAFVASPPSTQEEMPQQVTQGGGGTSSSPKEQPTQESAEGIKKENTTTNAPPPPVANLPTTVSLPPSPTLVAIDAFSLEEKLQQNLSRTALSTEQLCQGEFLVELIPDPTGQKPAATISFSLNGRELFTAVVHTLDQESMTTYEFAKIHFRTCAGLLRKTLMGMSGGVTSADLIVPHQGTFKTLQLEEWADIQDLDGDRADELLVQKLALGYECVDGASR